MLKFLKRLRKTQKSYDNVLLLLLCLDFIARTVDFSDCLCDVEAIEKQGDNERG